MYPMQQSKQNNFKILSWYILQPHFSTVIWKLCNSTMNLIQWALNKNKT
jgi:hypothetical protein